MFGRAEDDNERAGECAGTVVGPAFSPYSVGAARELVPERENGNAGRERGGRRGFGC